MIHNPFRRATPWERFVSNLPYYVSNRSRCNLRHPVHCQWFHILLGLLLALLIYALLHFACKKCGGPIHKCFGCFSKLKDRATGQPAVDRSESEDRGGDVGGAKKRKKQA
eukprot:Gregarina_sp_Poly_1__5552@NODE_292_length_9900_cov_48_311299_g253_i0_p8_GENE_NODE_292_length_9900_cov_48_311299_g253_i0NODE_292_length_9900_cov_48_311299_g253_i0_p8_ORF_typecomplete_len110_score5_51SPT_ssulike/PF11779_8/0_0036_NODE_292_length_9900_cov_48_311299_g253_i094669795